LEPFLKRTEDYRMRQVVSEVLELITFADSALIDLEDDRKLFCGDRIV
jgi:hypothetical protein